MARIERVNYDSYIKPLEHIQKSHNDTLADMANMSQQSEILDYYLDPNLDKESYNLYNNFKQEFNNQADDFARNGLTRSNGAKLLNLHRNYNRNVANVLDAVKNRETERAEQHKLFAESNGQVVFGKEQNADYKSVDDYLHGNKGYIFQKLDEVYKYAKNQAAAASKREYKENVADAVKVLDNNYYKILEETGYNTQAAYEKLDAMMADVANQMDLTYNPNNDPSIDPKDNPAGLIRNMREELRRRGLENYSDEDKHKIISSFLTGTYEGLGYDPKLTLKESDKLKKASRSVTSVNLAPPTEPVDPTDFNENEISIGSSFEDESSDRKRSRLIEDLSLPTNYFVKQVKTTDGYAQKLITPQEYAQQQFDFRVKSGKYHTKTDDKGNIIKDENGNPIYYETVITGANHSGDVQSKEVVVTPKLDDKKQKEYDDYVNNLTKHFYLTEAQKNAIKNGAFIKPILEQASKEIANMKKAVSQITYELIIPGDQTGGVLEMTRNRAKSGKYTGAHTGLKYNQNTGEYSFTDKVDNSTLDEFYNAPGAKQKGMLFQLVYAPMTSTDQYGNVKGDIFQVAFCSTAWDEPIFFPLSAFSSAKNSAETAEIYKAQQRSKIMIDALKEQLGCTNDADLIEEINEQIRIGNLQQDFLKKQILRKTSERGQIKSNNQFKDVFDADIKTLEPVKYKNKQYNKPKQEEKKSDGEEK